MYNKNRFFQKIAFNLAYDNLGLTYPNPSVAALLVKDGEIISKAVTSQNGGSHAEYLAIKNSKIQNFSNVDLYVTLEPCSHIGKNPACAKLIIDSGIKRVFYSYRDSNPLVDGKGVKMLQDNGVECVYLPVYEEEYRGFSPLRYDRNQMLISLKNASSLDMKMALKSGESKWITNSQSRNFGHYLRRINDITITGIGTIIKDNPMFNCRLDDKKQSHLAILDSSLRIPLDAKVLSQGLHKKIVIFYDKSFEGTKKINLLQKYDHIDLVPVMRHSAGLDLNEIVSYLLKNYYCSAIIESGPALSSSFVREGLVDLYYIFNGHKILGTDAKNSFEIASPEKLINSSNLSLIDVKTFGEDVLRVLAPKRLFKE
ncbi:bifunctional diaminohydroxyphosphoribosylaminopyrimidine deaminase/5-amino-6-(5-phosphoribosylamino)uracil reductase RibD [Rickettsiales bacterium]|nr:bifunctional diaminohydroxyphosphoribosylaminopyrimidine deaminase/5-amino-6-(5-phosphoribosylamino)uracil reductase RibD [Rickettsiales bacterium]